jgi:hypothetical protein
MAIAAPPVMGHSAVQPSKPCNRRSLVFSWRVRETGLQVASTVRSLPEVDLSHPLHSVSGQRQVWGGRHHRPSKDLEDDSGRPAEQQYAVHRSRRT